MATGPLTPDHIVYAKSFPYFDGAAEKDTVDAFEATHGYLPKVISVAGEAVFCAGDTR